MKRTRIAQRHACVTDRVVTHVFSYAGYVTASELEHPASHSGYLPSPGVAARSEPSHYKRVKAMHVFAHREKAGAQRVSAFQLARSGCPFSSIGCQTKEWSLTSRRPARCKEHASRSDTHA